MICVPADIQTLSTSELLSSWQLPYTSKTCWCLFPQNKQVATWTLPFYLENSLLPRHLLFTRIHRWRAWAHQMKRDCSCRGLYYWLLDTDWQHIYKSTNCWCRPSVKATRFLKSLCCMWLEKNTFCNPGLGMAGFQPLSANCSPFHFNWAVCGWQKLRCQKSTPWAKKEKAKVWRTT